MKKLYALFFGAALTLGAAIYAFSQSAIPGKEVVTVPPVEEKVFESSWVLRFQVEAPSPTTGQFDVYLQPYNATTGEISDQTVVAPEVLRGDLWQLMAWSKVNGGKAATAMGAVFAAVPEMRQFQEWVAAGGTFDENGLPVDPKPEPDPDPQPE